MQRSPKWIAWVLAGALLALVLLSFDWRAVPPPATTVTQQLHAHGPLRAGASRVDLTPDFPVPLGGFNTRGNAPHTGVLLAPQARALVVTVEERTVALVSAELVLVPAPLVQKVRDAVAGLGIDALVVTATHTHSSLGGYWDKTLAAWVGLGRYDPRIEAHLVERLASAVRQAADARTDARLSWSRIEASRFAFNRQRPGDPIDPVLTALRIDDDDGDAIARVVVYAAHPTIVPREEMRLSGDWPGSLMVSLEESAQAPVLFMQGAVGDATWGKREGGLTLEERPFAFGQALASDARGAIAAAGEGAREIGLAFARASFTVPAADAGGSIWGPFEPAGANVLHWLAHPGTSEVSFLKLGPARLAFVPGEPVADLGLAWRPMLGEATIVGLADDYLGYVETPERVEAEEGECVRHYFGPSFANVLLDALHEARAAADGSHAATPALSGTR